ncbi:MAG TPA: protein kinase [Kofleriaceae bacterium]|nr:protein kinase [Kofleriaceae bacterium]
MTQPSARAPVREEAPRAKIEPGTQVGHYEVIRLLGMGGMGEVHLARDVRLGRLVALKFIYSTSLEATRLVLIEARATAKCTHENIVVIHDIAEHHGLPYLVLEYLEGSSLGKLARQGRLQLARLISIMTAVVRALDHAHAAGIVHRDLKPDNIFVTSSGVVKVLDFGIAKLRGAPGEGPPSPELALGNLAGDETRMTLSSNGPIGTRPYMSPEQWTGVDVDHRTDIWAVGVILFRLISGELPFAHGDPRVLLYAVMSPDPVRSVAEVVPDVDPRVAAVIDYCLRKPKEERFPTAGALADALESLLPGRGAAAGDDRCPYPGLQAFQETDAERFFGRADQVVRVVDRLTTQPLVAVVGPSGAGKSSFIRAGVIPALKRDAAWETFVLRPGRSPLLALAALISPQVTHGDDVQPIAYRLFQEPGYLGHLLRRRAAARSSQILLYVDQFEELYTLVGDPQERAAFVTCLRAAADDPSSPIRVVLSLRSDFLDRAAEDRAFMASLTAGMHYLMPLGNEGLWHALVRPAEQAGHAFESPELVGAMLGEMANASNALPLLQFTAARMWDARDRANRMLTAASYHAMGGIAGALAVHADAVIAELSPMRRPLVQAVLQRLVTAEGTRAIVDLDELCRLAADPADVLGLIDQLVAARLLVSKSDDRGAGATVEIVHESLISAWPQLRQWTDASREEAAFLVQIRQAAQQWEARGCPDGLLWRGDAAGEARRFAVRLGNTLATRERRFLDAVIANAVRSGRIRRLAVAGTMILLAVIAVSAGIAVLWVRGAEQRALRQADEASTARHDLAAQLKLVQDKEAQRLAAQQTAEAADKDAQLSRTELEDAHQKLELAYQQVKQTNDQVKQTNEQLQHALDEARVANTKAQAAYDDEHKRNQALLKQRSKIATELR